MSELIRRATPGVALAGMALATVWIFDPALNPEVSNTAATIQPEPAATTPDSSPDAGAAAGPGTSSSADPPPTSDTDSPVAAGGCGADTTSVTGDAVPTRWGPVQVQMEFSGDGTVCAVQGVVYPDSDHHSAQLSRMAIPYLDSRAAAVGVEFDAVSGATYTSEAYRQSMQSILDRR